MSRLSDGFTVCMHHGIHVPFGKSKIFIGGSCPISFLTTVLVMVPVTLVELMRAEDD
jgi:hypothetical protein